MEENLINSTEQTPTTPEAQSTPFINQNNSVKKSGSKSKWLLAIFAILILLFVGGIGGYLVSGKMQKSSTTAQNNVTPTPQVDQGGQVACTMDAKQCPDGSYVSRQGPKCEFAPCPTGTTSTSMDTSTWKTYTNSKEGVSVSYPTDWALDSNLPTDTLFQFNNSNSSMPRVTLFRNFAGDWCNDPKTVQSKIKLSDGTSADKWDCSTTIAIQFKKNGQEYMIMGDFITENTYATVNKVIDSIKFTQ